MKSRNKKSGFAIPLAILASLSVALFIATLTTMNRGFRTNLHKLDTNQAMFNAAFSAYSNVLAKLREKSWDQRFFKDAPYIKNNVVFDRSHYSYQVFNTPGKEFQTDLYVKVTLQGDSRVYFWRFLYIDDILDTSGRAYPLVFIEGIESELPVSSIDAIVKGILDKRKQNQPIAQNKAKLANTLTNVNDVAEIVSATPGGRAPIPIIADGTQSQTAPEIPGVFKTTAQRQQIGESSPRPSPSAPPEFSGPQSFENEGTGSRVAVSDGTCSVDARCINEKGSVLYVTINGQTVLAWQSTENKTYEEMKAELNPGTTVYDWHNTLKRDFSQSFSVQAGQKVFVKYVGKRTSIQRSWFNLNGPF